MDLQESRKRLDTIDQELVSLFEKRMEICRDVARHKIETGKPVYDAKREQQKLLSVREMAHTEINKQGAEELFIQIMTISRRLQYQLLSEHGIGLNTKTRFVQVDALKTKDIKVVYQGVEGAYSHEAAIRYFGQEVCAYHVLTWEDAMKEVESGHAQYAVLPIENSSAGAVIDNYDLLVKYSNYIVAETYVPVCHALLGLPEASVSDIRTVYSHPQALMQCSQYLNANPQWKQMSVGNTAGAARYVFLEGDKTQAAIASEAAGNLHGLKVLKPEINHNKNNTTRFIIVARDPVYRKGADKISICFELPHKSGTLYNMLSNFIYNNVNMFMIESRPILGRNWEYRFFVDIEGSLGDASVNNALKGIEEEAVDLRILGNY